MAQREKPGQAQPWRKLLSPWLFAVAGAFLLGTLACSGGNGLVSRSSASSGLGGDLAGAAAADNKLRSGSRKSAAASKKRPSRVVEEEEDDDAGDDDDEPVPPTRRSSTTKKASSGSSGSSSSSNAGAPAAKPAGKAAAAAAGDWNAIARVPPKPASNPRSVTFPDGKTVKVFPHSDHTTGSGDWWNSVSAGWEADSLRALRLFSRLHKERHGTSVEVDFGCWVGPTVLFAAPYSDRVYAMEPDPSAFAEAYHNVQLNPAIAAKTKVQNLCISDKLAAVQMYGSPGDSMSTLFQAEKQADKSGYKTWTVECTTLDKFTAAEGITPADIGIIKLDTEGAEGRILVQLKDWLGKHKPTILLSMHVFLYPEDSAIHEKIKEVLYSYKTLLLASNGEPIDRAAFSVAGWCRLCTLILTEEELPSGFTNWKSALEAEMKG